MGLLMKSMNKTIHIILSIPFFLAGIIYGSIRLWFRAGVLVGDDLVRGATNENSRKI
jgi:hypothetical protein